MVTLQQFINAWNGKMIPSRGGITGQCVSMVQHWAEDQGVTGTPVFPVAAAKDMPGTRKDFFDWIPNTPTGVPQAGDIVVWGTQVGQWGHTAIFIDGNASSFRSFDQNWPVGSAAHIQAHNYNGVLGWLRLKKAAQPQGVIMDTDDGRWLYRTGLFREAENDGAAAQWNGLKPATAMVRLYQSAEWNMVKQKVTSYDNLANQVANLSSRPTKEQLQAIIDQLNISQSKVQELEKTIAEEQAKRTEDTQMVDEAAKSVNFIKRFFMWLDKRGQK
jgi:hypothetical protein